MKPKASEGADLLSQLIKQSNERIIIMPGSGINSQNIISIAKITGAREFHSSASVSIPSKMEFVNDKMDEDLTYVAANKNEVNQMATLLNSLNVIKVHGS